ncbi:Rho-GAP domain-containing protein [Entamoeba marina]
MSEESPSHSSQNSSSASCSNFLNTNSSSDKNVSSSNTTTSFSNTHPLLSSDNDTSLLTSQHLSQSDKEKTTITQTISPPVFLDEDFIHTVCNRKESKQPKQTIFDLEEADLCIPSIINNSLTLTEGDEKYQIELNESKRTTFNEFDSKVINVVGCDRKGNLLVVFNQDSLVNLTNDFAQRFYLYFIKTLHRTVQSNYVIIYVNEHYTLPYQLLYFLYRRLPLIYHANLKKIYSFIQPDINPTIPDFLSQEELNKFQIVSNLYDFYKEVPMGVFKIPLSLAEPLAIQHPIFGVPLIDAMTHPYRGLTSTPLIIESAIVYFSSKVETMSVEGLFRMNGSKFKTDKLISEFNQGLRIGFDFNEDPHVVSTVLKQYLRELPTPLLTYTIGERLSEMFNGKEPITKEELIPIITELPKENQSVLNHLVILGRIISSHSTENKMTSSNMGIMIGPCIYWTETIDIDAITKCKNINSFFTYLMDNADVLLLNS